MNFINSWKTGNKKNKIDICIRLGIFTILEIYFCPNACKTEKKTKRVKCDKCANFRFMILNFGFEI